MTFTSKQELSFESTIFTKTIHYHQQKYINSKRNPLTAYRMKHNNTNYFHTE